MGTMLAPREYKGAPFTRKNMPCVPVSLTCWLALESTTDAFVSFTVTRANTRNPMRRDVVAVSRRVPVWSWRGILSAVVFATGCHAAETRYSGCAPKPVGHHSLICCAVAWSSREITLSPAGNVFVSDMAPKPLTVLQLPDTFRNPVAPPEGTHRCVVTLTEKSPCDPSTSRAVGYAPMYRVCGVTCVMATVLGGTVVRYTDFHNPLESVFAGPEVLPDEFVIV